VLAEIGMPLESLKIERMPLAIVANTVKFRMVAKSF
jgi:hypothetical protein